MAGTPFDWKSLITPAVALGSKAVGDIVAPDASIQNARTNAETAKVSNEIALARMANANKIRSQVMPGMYTNLGFTPGQGQATAADYGATAGKGLAFNGGGGSGSLPGAPGLGSKIAKGALNTGLGLAPTIVGGLLKGGAAAGTTGGVGLGGTIAGLATNPFTIAAAGALAAGLIWKKSQAHPVANQWVQGEQNPFDQHWQELDKMGLPPDQLQAAKTQSAQNYLQELSNFAGQGGKNLEVARNAAATFRKYYGDPMKFGVQLSF
jgi:hypothetical protein